jgi:hypothetical protein
VVLAKIPWNTHTSELLMGRPKYFNPQGMKPIPMRKENLNSPGISKREYDILIWWWNNNTQQPNMLSNLRFKHRTGNSSKLAIQTTVPPTVFCW